MRTFLLCFILLLFVSCSSEPTISDIRPILESSQELMVDYKCCMYKPDSEIFAEKMERFVNNLEDDDLLEYFEKRGVWNKKVIARILHRNICVTRQNYGRPMTQLSDKQLELTLEYVQEQVLREFHHEGY